MTRLLPWVEVLDRRAEPRAALIRFQIRGLAALARTVSHLDDTQLGEDTSDRASLVSEHGADETLPASEGSGGKRTPRESGALPRPVDADPNDDVGVSADRKGYVAVSEVLGSNMKQLMVNIG